MKNMKRAANRRSGKLTEFREPEHNEQGFRASNSEHANFGSPASYGKIGSGPVAGAGELAGPHAGPGAQGKRLGGMDSNMYSNQVGSTAAPKGMDVIAEGEGPGHRRHNG